MLQKMEMPTHFDSCLQITEIKNAYNEGKQKGADLSEGIVMKSWGRPTLLADLLWKKQ